MTRLFRNQFFFIAFVLTPILFTSCNAAFNRRLAWHETELAKAANSKTMKPQEKLDVLMTSFVKMADETLKPINPKKGVKFVKKYSETNEANINKILKEVESWQKGMNDMQRIGAGVSLARKPYAKQVIDLYPKFRRNYKQYKFAMKMTDSLTGGLGKLGGNILKGL